MEKEKYSPDAFLRQRRNLIFISIALIIYYLGEGSIEGFFAIVRIDLNKPDIVIAFAWIAYLYSLWRYWLYMPPMKYLYNNEFIMVLQEDKWFKKTCKEIRIEYGRKIVYENLDEDNRLAIDSGKNSLEEIVPTCNDVPNGLPIIINKKFNRKLNYSEKYNITPSLVNNYFSKMDFENEPTLKAPIFKMYLIEILTIIKLILSRRFSTTYILPYILSLLAPISYFIKPN